MILRRITEHVKAQNWTAVALDFVIVVVGVFIGIQLGNWNEARSLEAQEDVFLRELKEEIRHNVAQIEIQEQFVGALLSGGERGLEFLASEQPCANNCRELIVDFFHASHLWGTGYVHAKFDEVQRLGWPSDPKTEEEVQKFYDFVDGWDDVNGTPPAYREQFRSYLPVKIARTLWSGCYALVGSTELLSSDCVKDIDEEEAAEILQGLKYKPDFAENLQYWMGQNISAMDFYPAMKRQAEAAIVAIEQEVEAAP
ncbi:MAG: DUF6090 family protein [Pseudomonadota bacterium]